MADVEKQGQADLSAMSAERLFAPFAQVIRENNKAIAQALGSATVQSAQLQNALAAISAVQMRARAALPDMSFIQATLNQMVPALSDISSMIRAWLPRNWPSAPEVGLDDAAGVMRAGIPLVWVPRAEIVAELVAAADAIARDSILVTSAADITDDCSAVLGEVTRPDLKDLAALAAQAAGAHRGGFPAPAQALATNVFDRLLRDMSARGVILQPASHHHWYEKMRQQIAPIDDETVLVEFRQACVMTPALPALATWLPGTPPPPWFGRHPTVHGAGLVQYSEVNAVIAVMLAASILREAEESGW